MQEERLEQLEVAQELLLLLDRLEDGVLPLDLLLGDALQQVWWHKVGPCGSHMRLACGARVGRLHRLAPSRKLAGGR